MDTTAEKKHQKLVKLRNKTRKKRIKKKLDKQIFKIVYDSIDAIEV